MQERSCKREGWRGKEKKRQKKVVRGRQRKDREKKRSLILIPSPHHLPSPALTVSRPPQRCPDRPTGLGTTTNRSPQTLRTPAMVQHHPGCSKADPWNTSSHQPAPPARDFNPQSSSPVHPVASIILCRGLSGGHHHLPTPRRYWECSRLQLLMFIH